MAKKRRAAPAAASTASAAIPAFAAVSPGIAVPAVAGAAVSAPALPAEVARGDWTVALFALMMFLAPALGVPNEEMLQDTLKSTIVSFSVLAAALLFLMGQRGRTEPLRWHGVVLLPLLLLAYALGSMAWSHAYLGGVEAVRWFIFSVIVWLGLNTLSRERLPLLALGIHAGAVTAALWAALQFWSDFRLFPQGPNPASTFINRNFFAEFVVCTLPFSAWLLARARGSALVAALSVTTGLVVTSILMTGTRAALIALWLQLLLVLPFIAWRCRKALPLFSAPAATRALAGLLLVVTVLGLGVIPSGNRKILDEERGATALQRAVNRTQSIRPDDYSLSLRTVMWKATVNAIRARPVAGLGAGAWENEIPFHQEPGAQLETDYYAHNEFLQLLAEYGLAGWLFLAALAAYLLQAAWRTWGLGRAGADDEAAARAVLLCSLLALMVVSNVGFPWRMASTGALFALCLAGLAASDARLGRRRPLEAAAVPWKPVYSLAGLGVTVFCLGLAAFVAQRAAESERLIVRATRIALSISASGRPNDPRWNEAKRTMLAQIKDGIDLNPHYRKVTPIVADELARWGDWKNALWIWESVLGSRPNVVAILSNVARAHATLGQMDEAMAYLERARRIQPTAPAVRSLEVVLLARSGQEDRAFERVQQALDTHTYDYDLLNAGLILALRRNDAALAARLLEMRLKEWPQDRARGYVQLGRLYGEQLRDPDRALQAFRQALASASSEGERAAVLEAIPAQHRRQLDGAAPASRAQ